MRTCSRLVAIILFGFFSQSVLAGSDSPPPPSAGYVVTYYDRNRDGKVDFELHWLPGGADLDWALADTTFGGYFTVRIEYGYAITREKIHQRVPRHVKITKGSPPVLFLSDAQTVPKPNHALQPTAGRRTAKFSMTRTSQPAATRALASGG